MKKNIFIFLLFFQCGFLLSQSSISKTLCLQGDEYLNTRAIDTLKNGIVAVGIIGLSTQFVFEPEHFLLRLAANGDLLWIKKFKPTSQIINTKINSLSNNTFVVCQNLFGKSYSYCFDEDGNILWSKEGLFLDKIIDLPQEKAFITDGLVKMKYDGTLVWQKFLYSSGSYYEKRMAKLDANHIILATELGEITTTAGRIDSIALLKIAINDGSIKEQAMIYGTNQDTLSLSALAVVNNKIVIGGGTNYQFTPQTNDRSRGLLAVFDDKFNFLWSKKLTDKKLDGFFQVSGLFSSYDNNLIVFCKNKTIAQYHPILKISLADGKIDSSIVYIPQTGSPNNYKVDNKLFIVGGVFSLNFFKSNNIFNPNTCKINRAEVNNQMFGLKVRKGYQFYTENANWAFTTPPDITFSNVATTSYNSCPECGCPQIQKSTQTICEGSFYQTKNGKKIYSAGLVIDTTTSIFNGCLRFEEITLTVTPTSKSTKDFTLCRATPTIKIANKTYSKSGTYQDTLRSKTGCDSVLTIHIKDLSDLSVSLGDDKEILEGGTAALEATTNYTDVIRNYVWLPQGTNTCDTCRNINVAPSKTQWYAVKVNKDGCSASDSINVKVLNQKLVYMPNAFSPNDDNINDLYRPYCAEGVAEIEYFRIYDRWGTLIYSINNYDAANTNIGWNGKFKNQPANRDVYTYAVQVRLRNGQTQQYLGDVFLSRD